MKRACLIGLSLAGLVAALAGCDDKYNKLYAAYQSCEGERKELRDKLNLAEERLNAALADRDRAVAAEKALRDRIDQLTKELADAREALAGASKAPVIQIAGPLPKAIDQALADLAKKYGLEYDPERGVVRFSSDLIFDLGSWNLKPEVAKQLADFANIINMPEAKDYDVLVVGHTDGVPISRAETKAVTPTNWHLSVYRAVSVVLALNKDGVGAGRLGAMGFGSERPRPGTSNAQTKPPGTKENRRVEVFIVPKKFLAATAVAPLVIHGDDLALAD